MPPNSPTICKIILLFATILPLEAGISKTEAPPDCVAQGFPSPTAGVVDPTPFTPEELDAARKVGLERHNYFRQLHDAPPLTLDNDLNNLAMHAAECNVKWNVMTHTQYGENLYYYATTSTDPFDLQDIAKKAVESWYEEYCWGGLDPKEPGKGHFTQVVWKSSLQLGMGFSGSIIDPKTGFKSVFVAGRYLPFGNWNREEDTKVGKLGGGLTDDKQCCRSSEPRKGVLLSNIKAGMQCAAGGMSAVAGQQPPPQTAPQPQVMQMNGFNAGGGMKQGMQPMQQGMYEMQPMQGMQQGMYGMQPMQPMQQGTYGMQPMQQGMYGMQPMQQGMQPMQGMYGMQPMQQRMPMQGMQGMQGMQPMQGMQQRPRWQQSQWG